MEYKSSGGIQESDKYLTKIQLTDDDLERLRKLARKKVQEECKEWAKISQNYNTRAATAEDRLDGVLKTTSGNIRQALHGNRRSKYVAPPKFDLSYEELQDEVNAHLETAHNATLNILEQRRKYEALQKPNPSMSTSVLNATCSGDSRQISLHSRRSDGPNLTAFDKSTRSIFQQIANKD